METFSFIPKKEILDMYAECLSSKVKGKSWLDPTDFFKHVTYWEDGPFAVDPLGRQLGVIVDNV